MTTTPHLQPPAPPPRRAGTHLWPLLAGGLIPLLLTTGYRLVVSNKLAPNADLLQLWRACHDGVSFWLSWTAAGIALARLVPSRLAGTVRIAFHGLTALIAVAEVLDLSFTQVTGNRIDTEALRVLVEAAPQTLPVVLSEAQPIHGLALGLAVLATLGALRWRPTQTVSWPAALATFGALITLPVASAVWPGRYPKAPLRALSTHLFAHLWTDARDRSHDQELPPAPADLAPLALARSPSWKAHNIVLITLESTAARHTTLHNPALTTTPNLAALARDGLAVRAMYATVPHTSKALVTLLCGAAPRLDAPIVEAEIGGLPGRCLPELLAEQGYRTAFFQTAREDFEDRYRLVHNLRFDHFRAADTVPKAGYERVNYFGDEDLAMLGPGLEWSSQEPGRPFLATYVTLTSHHDYGVPAGWPVQSAPGGPLEASRHLTGVSYVDHFVGQLIEGYRRLGLADNTLFILVGDHGEGFGEHGRFQHDLVIHDEGLHVPAVLYGPKILGDRRGWIEGNRDQRDLLPTVLDLVGLWPTAGTLSGRSLFTPADPARTLNHSCWRSARCLAERSGSEKFIDFYADAPALLFDLSRDPNERAGERPSDLDARRERLRAWRARVNGAATARRQAALAALVTPDDQPAQARWEGGMELLGCRAAATEVMTGDGLWLTCKWRAGEHLDQGWKLRATLEIDGREAVTTWTPTHGDLPTWTWEPGHAIEDTFRVKAPRGFPEGNAVVRLGWSRLGGSEVAGVAGPAEVEVARFTLVAPPYGQSLLPPQARRTESTAAHPPSVHSPAERAAVARP
jgi:lipoteichoic acid synthase